MSAPVLLVEDSDDDIFFFRRAMKRAELEDPLFIVKNGRAAIDYLKGTGDFSDRARFPLPHLVILDLKLPYVGGMEVLEWIRTKSSLSTMIVVIFTSSHLETEVERAYHLRANSFIVKPGSADRMVEVVKGIFGYWCGLNTPPSRQFTS